VGAEKPSLEPVSDPPSGADGLGEGPGPAPAWRFPLLILGFVSLGAGLAAGLGRLGWHSFFAVPSLAPAHAPLMTGAFLGTLIALERAVASGKKWVYLAPLGAGLGGILLITGIANAAVVPLFVAAGLVFVAASMHLSRRRPGLPLWIMTLGALCWPLASLVWAMRGATAAAPWWAAFLILTIFGERLELSRLRPMPARGEQIFMVLVLLYLAALVLTLLDPPVGRLSMAAILPVIVLGLWRYDIARATIATAGLPRFVSISVLAAYFWLVVASVTALFTGGLFAPGRGYDPGLHAVFLGFVFSMVFAHAPIIFPAVTGFRIAFHPLFYLHLALLHASLLARVFADYAADPVLRMYAGAANAAAIVLFVFNTVAAVARGRKRQL